jgi:FixJ family two-component response regulator
MIMSDPMDDSSPRADDAAPVVAILEDDAVLADLAAELCASLGLRPDVHATPAPFLDAIGDAPPAVMVLDWRLQDQLGAAAFMAVRHRLPDLPVVCWTASPGWRLPEMIRRDPMTQVVDKAAGAIAFEAALRQALALEESEPLPEGAGDVRPLPHPA